MSSAIGAYSVLFAMRIHSFVSKNYVFIKEIQQKFKRIKINIYLSILLLFVAGKCLSFVFLSLMTFSTETH